MLISTSRGRLFLLDIRTIMVGLRDPVEITSKSCLGGGSV